MDVIRIERLSAPKSLVIKNSSETNISKENDDIFVDEIDEDDEIRLRLSDDEEFEQDKISGLAFQTNLQLRNNDLKNSVAAEESSKLHVIKSKIKTSSTQKTKTSLSEDETSSNSSLDEKISNEIDDIDDNKTTMSGTDRTPPLIQNSSKYWQNSFNKRWKGVNTPRDRSTHRKSSDWISKAYSEKNKNNFNNHSKNHFNNRVRDSDREKSIEKSKSNFNKDSKKKEIDTFEKIKNHFSGPEKSTNKNNKSVEVNGVSDDSNSKENISYEGNESIVTEKHDSNFVPEEKELEQVTEIDSDTQQSGNSEITKKEQSDDDEHEGPSKDGDGSKLTNKEHDGTVLKDSSCDNSTDFSEKMCGSNLEDEDEHENLSKSVTEETNNKMECYLDSEELKEKEDLSESKEDNIEKPRDTNTEIIEDTQCSTGKNDVDSDDVPDLDLKEEELDIKEDSGNLTDDDTNIEKTLNTEEKLDDPSNDEQRLSKMENCKKEDKNLEVNEDSNMSSKSDKSIVISEMDISENEIENESLSEEKKVSTHTEKTDELMDTVDDSNSFATTSESMKSEFIIISKNGDKNKDCNSEEIVHNENKNKIEIKENLKKQDSIKTDESVSKVNSEQKKVTTIEEVDLIDDETEMDNSTTSSNDALKKDAPKENSLKSSVENGATSEIIDTKIEEVDDENREVVHKKKRRKRDQLGAVDVLSENGTRQKRLSARNAEEMIRQGILINNEDDEDSSDSNKFVTINYKKSNLSEPLSPPTLKRTRDDSDNVADNIKVKKIKTDGDEKPSLNEILSEKKDFVVESKEKIQVKTELVRKVSQEDLRRNIKKMTKEEMEAVLLQKIVECIAVRGEMGKLREQARSTKRNLESTRTKCQQLQKQVEGFDMVLKRISYDKANNSDKVIQPIKINRSVGLQVNFMSQENGILSLRQVQALKSGHIGHKTIPNQAHPGSPDSRSLAQSPKKVVKVRSPKAMQTLTPPTLHPIISSSVSSNSSNSAPMTKSVEQPVKRFSVPASNSVVYSIPSSVVNSNVNLSGGVSRQNALTIQRANSKSSNTSDLIDLTDEEDKVKTPVKTPASLPKVSRVLQSVPNSVTISNPTNLRLVQAGNSGSPPSLVNNNSTVTYLMQNGVNGQRQIVLKTNSIRPVTAGSASNVSRIYKQGPPTTNGSTMRIVTAQPQISRHPAPLPDTPQSSLNPHWKLPPPAPSLKISKVATGIVLSWNMTVSEQYAKIVSYQLFAYQEITGQPPNSTLWKKVGDVAALPLPMACTLTQFTEGNNYHFAVRAVDTHSRCGHYSKPGNISL